MKRHLHWSAAGRQRKQPSALTLKSSCRISAEKHRTALAAGLVASRICFRLIILPMRLLPLHHLLPNCRRLACLISVALLCYLAYQQRWVYVTWEDPDSPAGQLKQQQSREEQNRLRAVQNVQDQQQHQQQQQQQLQQRNRNRVEELIRLISSSAQSQSVSYNRTSGAAQCTDRVPLLFHQIYAGQSIPEAYRGHLLSCLRLNWPDIAYVLWTDSDAAAFLADKFPSHMSMFLTYAKTLQRSDALRYFILSYYGGIYADMDVQCLRPFKDLAATETCFLDQERQEQSQILYGTEYAVMNSVMGCSKGHPFFDLVIKKLHYTSKAADILRSTGPLFLTDLFRDFLGQPAKNIRGLRSMSPEVFSPLMDTPDHFRGSCDRWKRLPGYFQMHRRFRLRMESCRSLQAANFGQSEDRWLTNNTIAVHRFMHLGYLDPAKRRLPRFDLAKVAPEVRVLRYKTDAKEIERMSNTCYLRPNG